MASALKQSPLDVRALGEHFGKGIAKYSADLASTNPVLSIVCKKQVTATEKDPL